MFLRIQFLILILILIINLNSINFINKLPFKTLVPSLPQQSQRISKKFQKYSGTENHIDSLMRNLSHLFCALIVYQEKTFWIKSVFTVG